MQNLSVMESWEGELQILSTDGRIDHFKGELRDGKEVSRANVGPMRKWPNEQWMGHKTTKASKPSQREAPHTINVHSPNEDLQRISSQARYKLTKHATYCLTLASEISFFFPIERVIAASLIVETKFLL